ncbi:3'-5' exonuclease [Tardiphaga sp. 604_B6_N1_1]|uniref:3'-5' exonuclease n=1 Tax=Tardiphaga sp. 604_B6_N1_1 TaxID=3240779 RepID=UPI003F24E662
MKPMNFEECAKALEETGDYKVLRRLIPRRSFNARTASPTKRAIVLDIETTGLNQTHDEIIELAMLKFDYSPDGLIYDVVGQLAQLSQPTRDVSKEVLTLTGLTLQDLQGQKLCVPEINSFIEDASLIIAHNASFDRPFCERLSQNFSYKPWACSMSEIRWKASGFTHNGLVSILTEAGLFYKAHRATADCNALLELLSRPLPNSNEPAFKKLLSSARMTTIRIWAIAAAYEKRSILKERGYKWSDGSNGSPRSWWIDVPETKSEEELLFLRENIVPPGAKIQEVKLTAHERYSTRIS